MSDKATDLATSTPSNNHNNSFGHNQHLRPAIAETSASQPAPLLCEDVLIDVCRWMTRRQLATSIAPLGRRCWYRLFQPGQPLSEWPMHLAHELDISMDGGWECVDDKPTKEFFSVSIRSSDKQEELNLFLTSNNDDDEEHDEQPFPHMLLLPDYIRFKIVRIQLFALREEYQSNELHHRLDTQKLALVESLFGTFKGSVTILCCWFFPEEFVDRADLSAFLSHEFFVRLFANFEIVKFSGSALSLSTNDDQIAQQPLLLLPGLLQNKRRLLFACSASFSDFHAMDDFFWVGIDEIVSWLNHSSDNKERILYIREIGYREPPDALVWLENLLDKLKERLLGSNETRPYTLYIDGPLFDWPIENDHFGGLSRGMVASNPRTYEQLLFDAFDPDHDTFPSGQEFVITKFVPKPLGMFRRITRGDG